MDWSSFRHSCFNQPKSYQKSYYSLFWKLIYSTLWCNRRARKKKSRYLMSWIQIAGYPIPTHTIPDITCMNRQRQQPSSYLYSQFLLLCLALWSRLLPLLFRLYNKLAGQIVQRKQYCKQTRHGVPNRRDVVLCTFIAFVSTKSNIIEFFSIPRLVCKSIVKAQPQNLQFSENINLA